MGETQIYSQRLHGITEKRRILGEVDNIQRELDIQKMKLQQLKRKSLRDRWLMEGLVPVPGAETENPLNETEDKIKKLEDELESLQLQLLYLENPELKIEHLRKQQESNMKKPLVNGDQSQQISDQKDRTPGKRELHKEHKVIQEEDIQPNGEDEKQEKQKDPNPSKDVVAGHPIPAPRGIRVSGNYPTERSQDQTSPEQKLLIVDQRNNEEVQNFSHSLEPQDDRSKNLSRNAELKDDQEHVYTNQDLVNQDSQSLDKRLELEEEDVEHLTEELEHIDLNFNIEDIRNDLDNQYKVVKVTLFDRSDQHESKMQPSIVIEKLYEGQDEPVVRDNADDNGQNVEENSVSVSVTLDHNEDMTVPGGNRDQSEEYALPRCREEPVDSVPVLISHNKDQDMESTLAPVHQSLVVMSSDQEQGTTLPCNDPDPSVSLPCETLVSQVEISQVVVISAPGHAFSEEPVLPSSDSQQDLPTDHHRPGTTEASTPPESQPLLHKPPETDAQSGPQGANTAETRDKNPPVKKKSCQCCVVM